MLNSDLKKVLIAGSVHSPHCSYVFLAQVLEMSKAQPVRNQTQLSNILTCTLPNGTLQKIVSSTPSYNHMEKADFLYF